MVRSILALAALAACVTPYQERGVMGGGYTDMQLGENTFRVSYEGRASGEEASDYALLRSAELAKEKGFRYFVVASGENTLTARGIAAIRTIVCYKEKPADPSILVYEAGPVVQSMRA